MISELLDFQTEFSAKVEKDNWQLELLRPMQQMNRASLIAEYLNHAPFTSVSAEDYSMALIIATLQLAYRDGPDWFKKRCDEKMGNIPDNEYILELHKKYADKEEEFEKIKKKSGHNSGSKKREVDTSSLPLDQI